MKKIIVILLTFITFTVVCQENIKKNSDIIVHEINNIKYICHSQWFANELAKEIKKARLTLKINKEQEKIIASYRNNEEIINGQVDELKKKNLQLKIALGFTIGGCSILIVGGFAGLIYLTASVYGK